MAAEPKPRDGARHAVPKPDLRPAREAANELDRLIHEPARLGIISALAAAESLSFNDLKEALGLTDGNLAVHARKLEEAGYVDCRKSYRGRKPHTSYRLTARGRRALERYIAHMEAIVAAARQDT
jgi:DNA-binding MarR family transcriptional regulator